MEISGRIPFNVSSNIHPITSIRYRIEIVGLEAYLKYMEMNHIERENVIVNIYTWPSLFIFLGPVISDWMENNEIPLLLLLLYFLQQPRFIHIELCRGEVQESLNDIVLRLYSPYISAYITQNSPAGENPEHLTSVFFVYFFFLLLLLPGKHITRTRYERAHIYCSIRHKEKKRRKKEIHNVRMKERRSCLWFPSIQPSTPSLAIHQHFFFSFSTFLIWRIILCYCAFLGLYSPALYRFSSGARQHEKKKVSSF
jgi:hypothetical protein